jgi:hypothetical protein
MKTKLTPTILACMLAAGMASAQSPSIIQNTRERLAPVKEGAAAASNQALSIGGDAAPSAAEARAKAKPVKASAKKSAPSIKPAVAPAKPAAAAKEAVPAAPAAAGDSAAADSGATEQSVTPDNGKYASANGRRDPFISPVVSHAGGSGCSTGKKCLEIGNINLKGVVHSEGGFIAVVSNSMNKAYFLRENDPVFNGYVVRITGDSIVFQETLQDRLGKTFTREVVKKITTPAV